MGTAFFGEGLWDVPDALILQYRAFLDAAVASEARFLAGLARKNPMTYAVAMAHLMVR